MKCGRKKGDLFLFILGMIFIFMIIFVTNIVSAQYYRSSSYYGAQGYSFSDLLNQIDPNTLVLFVVFILSFTMVYYSSLKFFRRNKALSSIVSFSVSLITVYWINSMISSPYFNIQNFFYGMGFSRDILHSFLYVLVIGVIIFLSIKLKRKAFFLIGTFILVLSLTDLVYENAIWFFVGVCFWVAGFLSGKIKEWLKPKT